MLSSLGCLLLCGSIALALGNAQKLPKGKRPSLKVHVNTTSDSIFLKFLRPNPNVKLEGFLLGYGSNVSPNQYFPLPADGKHTEAVVDAEPKYLIVVRPAPPRSQKKSCSGKSRTRKPLQLVIGTLTPSSVFLSWGFLINPHHDWTLPSHCPNDRLYTIRYREKDKEKKWVFQLCPSTETIVENLKPDTVYEFGVKDNRESGIWSKIFNHKTIVGSKKVNGKIQSTYDQVHQVPSYVPRKPIPITIIKQVIQNVTHRASIKSPDKTPLGGTIVVHLIVPGLNETTIKLPTSIMFEISDAIKTQLTKNETLALPAESKTPDAEKVPAQPITVTPEPIPRATKPTKPASSALDISETALGEFLGERTPETPQTTLTPRFDLPASTLVSSTKLWIPPATKMFEDSKILQPQTATYGILPVFGSPTTYGIPPVFGSPPTSDEPEIAEPSAATRDPILDSVPPKTSRTHERPRATLAPRDTSFVPQKPEILTIPDLQPTTPAPQPTTSIPSTPKRRSKPKPSRTKTAPSKTQFFTLKPTFPLSPEVTPTKAAPETQTVPPSPSAIVLGPGTEGSKPSTTTLASKRRKPGHRRRPKTTRSPEVPKTKPVPATDIEPATVRAKVPGAALVPQTTQRTQKRRPHSKHKTTPRPVTSPTKLGFEPITPGTSLAPTTAKVAHHLHPKPKPMPHPAVPQTKLVPATVLEPASLRTDAPETTLAPQMPHRPRHPSRKRKPTPRPPLPHPELVLEPVTPIKEAPGTAFVPVTDPEPVTFRARTSGTPLVATTAQGRRRVKKPKSTRRPKKPQITPVPTPGLKPVTLKPDVPETRLVPTEDLEPVMHRTEPWLTTQAPKSSQRTHHQSLKPKKKPTPASPLSKPGKFLATVFEPVTLRTEPPPTTLASKTSKRTRRPPRKSKTTPSPEASQSRSAPTELQTPHVKPVTSPPSLEIPPSEPASGVLESTTFSPESLVEETIAPADPRLVHPTPTEPLQPEEPATGAAVESITNVSEPPETSIAPKQTPRAPAKPKASPPPKIPQGRPAPKETQRIIAKPQTPPSGEVSYTTTVPEDRLLPHKPDPEASLSEPVLQPATYRIDPPKTTIASVETRGSPFRPMASPSPGQQEPQATQEPDQSTQEHFTTKIPRTPYLTRTTQAPHRLYTTPMRPRTPDRSQIKPAMNRTIAKPRPKPSGIPKGNGVRTGVKQPIPGTGRNTSVVSTHSTKRPATMPGTRRPPLPPRPTPVQRKPLPRNHVTGKPGSAGIISSGRVTSPPLRATLGPAEVPRERTEKDQKQPTSPASREELGNITDFNTSPTRETDRLGKPRFTASHVRYIPKPDNQPCSITDSVRLFPQEEVPQLNASSPPQNPPTNLTVVTVEGCPSFVILDWEKPHNDTVTEYEVISRENGTFSRKNKSIQVTNQTFSTVENLKPNTSYQFEVKPKNPLGEGPPSKTVTFSTESADPLVSEPVSAGRDAIWTERPFSSDSYSECKGKQYVKRTWYKKFVGVQLCNSLRYKIYLSDSLTGKFYNIGDLRGHGEDHCQFVDSFLDGRTGQQLTSDQLPTKEGYFRAVRQEPVQFGEIGGHTHINYVQWYECGTTIPGKW
ncbi:target of Nesh-SH3 isoform X2 [Tenrec ecaudatus]|uniref:target of Nesh-SH3 isoform X2 n=1 Tax=Tenrec ecaudatus TaxID=94439 RepID=UPI003F593EC9